MRMRWPIAIILFFTLALSLATGSTILWRLFIFLMVLLFMSYFWMRLNSRSIDGKVTKISPLSQVGERFEEECTFYNRGRLPTTIIEVREDTDFPDYQGNTKFHLPAQGSYSWRSQALCQRRGAYNMGNFIVKISNPLGFFSVKKHIYNNRNIIVYPATIELPYFQVLPYQEMGVNKRRWFISESGTNAARVRQYISGDSLRNIHWRTTAHVGSLMVKEFDPDSTKYAFKDVWIILDMKGLAHCGKGEETTEEYAVTIAASLVKKYIDIGKNVGLISSGEPSSLIIPETGDEHLQKLMQTLAVIKATGKLSLDALLASQEEYFKPDAAIIVITPSGNIQVPLRRVVNRCAVVTAVLLDAASFGGKTNARETARSLIPIGIHAYIVNKGAGIARALDSRFSSAPSPYIGAKQ